MISNNKYMNQRESLFEQSKIIRQMMQDPKKDKKLRMLRNIAKFDKTIPLDIIRALGAPDKRGADADMHVFETWVNKIQAAIDRAFFNNPQEGHKLLPYILNHYLDASINYEDITGELVDNLRKWWILKNRGVLAPVLQDVNKISPHFLQILLGKQQYRDILQKVKNEEQLERAKRQTKEVVLIDDDDYRVAVPFSYGSCYVFNNAGGIQANFCTGGSSGQSWFERYAPGGPMIMVTDKKNANNEDGKWQIHANTAQIVNSQQSNRWNTDGNSKKFAMLFPGLMQRIEDSMREKKDELTKASKEAFPNEKPYNIEADILDQRAKFPNAYLMPKKQDNDNQQQQQQP